MANVTMRDIAEKLGATPETLYTTKSTHLISLSSEFFFSTPTKGGLFAFCSSFVWFKNYCFALNTIVLPLVFTFIL